MKKIITWFYDLLFLYVGWTIAKSMQKHVDDFVSLINNAPICHGLTEYIGETVGFTSSKFYQCRECKKVIIK